VLPPADGERDGITAPLDRTGTRALADHAADSPREGATDLPDEAAGARENPLRDRQRLSPHVLYVAEAGPGPGKRHGVRLAAQPRPERWAR
jgi:hypothetical protein